MAECFPWHSLPVIRATDKDSLPDQNKKFKKSETAQPGLFSFLRMFSLLLKDLLIYF